MFNYTVGATHFMLLRNENRILIPARQKCFCKRFKIHLKWGETRPVPANSQDWSIIVAVQDGWKSLKWSWYFVQSALGWMSKMQWWWSNYNSMNPLFKCLKFELFYFLLENLNSSVEPNSHWHSFLIGIYVVVCE